MPITLPQCSGQPASGRHSHSSCDRSPIHHLRSLLRHPGRCGGTVEPAVGAPGRGSLCDIFSLVPILISRDGRQIQPIPHGCFGSASNRTRDLVRESRVQSNRQLSMGRSWHVATQHHGQRGHRFVITCLDVICAGIVTCCSTSASQGGLDFGVALPLRDAQRCRPRLVNQR